MDKNVLVCLVGEGLSSYKIAERVNLSPTTVFYWLKKYGLKTNAPRNPKKGIITTISKKELELITLSSVTLSEILKKLNLPPASSYYRSLKNRLLKEQIDFDHIKMGINSNKGRKFIRLQNNLKSCLENCFIENSHTARSCIKKYLRRFNLIDYYCSSCDVGDSWNGQPLSLQLDHINGICDDNRLSNLRFLCPNCHSQTENFSGKSARKNRSLA